MKRWKTRINKIIIKNYKGIDFLRLAFPYGHCHRGEHHMGEDVWIFQGANGIGKSSLLEACFELVSGSISSEYVKGTFATKNRYVIFFRQNRTINIHHTNERQKQLLAHMKIQTEYPSLGQAYLLNIMETIADLMVAHVVLIDLPELHLNEYYHRKLIRWILNNYPQHQYIIATHSEEIITSVTRDCRYYLSK